MSKSTKYQITFALLITTALVVGVSIHLSAAYACCVGTSIFISAKTKMGKLINPAVENVLFVQESASNTSLLMMVQIRTKSARGLKQLRAMHLDIVSVRLESDRGDGLFSEGYIVEAVVTKGELTKLKTMGFEVSEIPEKN